MIMFAFIWLLALLATKGNSHHLYNDQFDEQLITYLHVDIPHVQDSLLRLKVLYSENHIHIYCHRNQELRLGNIFQSNRLQLQLMPHTSNGDYRQYRASTAHGVLLAHGANRECHEDKLLVGSGWQLHHITLPSHDHACYGIYTDQAYKITLLQVSCDKRRVARFLAGLVLWATATLGIRGDCLICSYSMAMVLGIHLIGLTIVNVTLLCHGVYELQSYRALYGNFILILQHYPTSVALASIAGAWLLLKMRQRFRGLWHNRWARLMNRHLPQLLSYMLLLGASNHSRFGWYFIGLLMLCHRFRAQLYNWEPLAKMRSLQQFSKCLSNDDNFEELVQIEKTDDDDEDADAVQTPQARVVLAACLNRSDRNLYSNRCLQQLPHSSRSI